MDPLNPLLYEVLSAVFGTVQVSNEGQERLVVYAPDYTPCGVRLQASPVVGGEEYRVNCPFCPDARGRLYVNHCYGEYDGRTGSWNYHLWHCFNQDCHEEPANRDALRMMLTVNAFWAARAGCPRVRTQPDEAAEPEQQFQLPDGLVPVSELPAAHPAATYLTGRGFDLNDLWNRWGVSYSAVAPDADPPVFDRIVIPILRPPLLPPAEGGASTELAGWQARCVGDPPAGAPKYLFCRGLRKSRLLYGLPHLADSSGPVIVCEGPTDVWRLQTNAVALFGKTLSDAQRRLLVRHAASRPIVVLLDRDAAEEAQRVRRKLLAARWVGEGDFRVVMAELPEGGKDPADFTREQVMERVTHSLAADPNWWRG